MSFDFLFKRYVLSITLAPPQKFRLPEYKTQYSLRLEQRNESVVGKFSGNLVDSVILRGFNSWQPSP